MITDTDTPSLARCSGCGQWGRVEAMMLDPARPGRYMHNPLEHGAKA